MYFILLKLKSASLNSYILQIKINFKNVLKTDTISILLNIVTAYVFFKNKLFKNLRKPLLSKKKFNTS